MIYCANIYCCRGTFENLQNIDEEHYNKDIWAFAYKEDERATNLMCKPVKGRIVKSGDSFPSYNFYEYKANNKDLKKNGVSLYARFFTDTYEEAVEGFNMLVNKRIDSLQKEIIKLDNMLIKDK